MHAAPLVCTVAQRELPGAMDHHGYTMDHNGQGRRQKEGLDVIECIGMLSWTPKWATLDIICRGSKLVIVCSFQSLQTSTYIKARSVEIPVLQPFFQRTSTRFFKQSHGVVSALESVAPPSLFESQAARRFPLFCLATWLSHSAFIGQSQVVFGAQLSAILPN